MLTNLYFFQQKEKGRILVLKLDGSALSVVRVCIEKGAAGKNEQLLSM